MRDYLVYLAGGISGLTLEQANTWREYVVSQFPDNIKGLSPLRGKSYLKEIVGTGTLADHYQSRMLSTPQGINLRDHNDVYRSDAILVNLLGAKTISIGTVMEIAWAFAYRKPTFIVMEPENIHQHAMVRESCNRMITENLDEAIDLIRQFFRVGA